MGTIERSKVWNKIQELDRQFYEAKEPAERAHILTNSILLSTIAISSSRTWQGGIPTLVSIKMPKEVAGLMRAVAKEYEVSQADLESALVNMLISFGLPHMATHILQRVGLLDEEDDDGQAEDDEDHGDAD